MPKYPFTPEFVAGYIHRAMEQLRTIVHRLDERRDFLGPELGEIERTILDIDLDIQEQSGWLKDGGIKQKMKEYQQLLKMANRGLREVKSLAGIETQRSPQSSPLRFGDVDMAEYEESQPSVFGRLGQRQNERDDLSLFASDDEEGIPLHRMSVVKPVRTFKPVEFVADLEPIAGPSHRSDIAERDRLQLIAWQTIDRAHRQERVRNERADRQDQHRVEHNHRNQPGKSAKNHRDEQVRVEPTRSGRIWSELTSNAATVESPHPEYVAAPQIRHSAPISGITYPEVMSQCPVNMARNDPSLIGSAEMYTRPPSLARICPQCHGYHRLYHCNQFMGMSLQMRWYRALKMGVCLYCFRSGHSSFTCENLGCCRHCGTRHNSKLCPKNPNMK